MYICMLLNGNRLHYLGTGILKLNHHFCADVVSMDGRGRLGVDSKYLLQHHHLLKINMQVATWLRQSIIYYLGGLLMGRQERRK